MKTPDESSRLLLNALPVGILITSLGGEVQFASPQAHSILTSQASALIYGSIFDFFHPQDQQPVTELFEATLHAESAQSLPVTRQYRLKPSAAQPPDPVPPVPTASVFSLDTWVEVTFAPLVDEHGQTEGCLITLQPTTHNQPLEEFLRQNLEQQKFLTYLLQLLYRPADLIVAMEQVLEMMGIYTKADAVFFMEDDANHQRARVVQAFIEEDMAPFSPELEYARYPSIRRNLEAHGLLCCCAADTDLPADLAKLLREWQISALMILPILGNESNYGLIVDVARTRCTPPSHEERDMLRSISRAVSLAVARGQVEEEERSQRVLAEVLRDISSALISASSFEDVLDRILVNLERVIPHQGANIAMVEADGTLRIHQGHGYPEEMNDLIRRVALPSSQWNTFRRVSQFDEPLLIPDVTQDADWVVMAGNTWTRSYIGVAIRARGQMLGILNVDSPIPNFFTAKDAARVQAFANQAAIAMENSRLFAEAQSRAAQMTTLYQMGLTLTQGVELDDVLATLHSQCGQVLPNDCFYVGLYDAHTDQLEIPIYYGDGGYLKIPARLLTESPGLSGEVIFSRRTLYLPDSTLPEVEKQYQIIRFGDQPTRTYLGVPLIVRDRVIGVMSIQRDPADGYTQDEIRLFETIAHQAAMALENAQIFKQLRMIASTDSLTGVFTRWHFTQLAKVEIERAQRYGHPLAVLMMDIDHFKKFNDTYGHATGDDVVRAVASMCSKGLRSSDVMGRYGGDEFVILLPETDLEAAARTAERIRSMVNTIEVSTPESVVQITISMGLATLAPRMTLDTLLIMADRALYQAKNAGRNLVKVYQAEEKDVETSQPQMTDAKVDSPLLGNANPAVGG